MLKITDTIYIAGHQGLVGSAIVRKLRKSGFQNLIFRSHSELDLIDQSAVSAFFLDNEIDYVVLAAAKVGGIHANNTYPAEFIYNNLMIQCNIINGAWKAGIKNLLFLGSSCIYPREAPQPMKEEFLLTSPLEPTNEPYALAKIAGIKLCESYNRQYGSNYRSVMPTNLYGPEDNFHEQNSHVIPALIRRFHQAKMNADPSIEIWGTGNAKREFLYIDDMADACISVMLLDGKTYKKNTQPMLSHINVGTGEDVTIKKLAETIKEVTGYQGEIRFDTTKPDGPARKLLQVDRLNSMGWRATMGLKEGLEETYQWFLEHIEQIRK